MTPARITDPAVGASVWASGSQVCSGKSGTLTAKAMAKAAKSHMAVLGDSTAGSVVTSLSRTGRR